MNETIMIDLGDGTARTIRFITSTTDGGSIVIELADERAIWEIAREFDARETITRTDTIRPNEQIVYTGFSELIDVRRNQINGAVRMTLKKP